MKKSTAKPAFDLFATITAFLIEQIMAGVAKTGTLWIKINPVLTAPKNLTSKRLYTGINRLILWLTAETLGYTSPDWLTFKQAEALGYHVRKGEKATRVVFWKQFNGENDAGEETKWSFAKSYCVFNVAQIEDYAIAAPVAVPMTEPERIERIETFITALSIELRFGGDRAFYCPSTDHIQMPNREQFTSSDAFYAVLFHEIGHWTASKSRLNRDLSGRFGSNSYCAEELIAEITAAYLCGNFELTPEPRPDHAAYLDAYLKLMKADTKAILTASSHAQKATDYLLARAGEATTTANDNGAAEDETALAA